MSEEKIPAARMCIPLFLWGVLLMFGLSFLPFVLQKTGTALADHTLAGLVFWSMSAALVRGFGYIPVHRLPRWLLGGWASAITALLAALWRLHQSGYDFLSTI